MGAMRMTWADFKRAVDEALAERGKADGDIDINWIDVSYPERLQLTVAIDGDNHGLEVS